LGIEPDQPADPGFVAAMPKLLGAEALAARVVDVLNLMEQRLQLWLEYNQVIPVGRRQGCHGHNSISLFEVFGLILSA
jgi:hypothetical protein